MNKSGRVVPAPVGLPGEQQKARERRAGVRRKLSYALAAILGWGGLTLLVGPTEASLELPALGPATRDLNALRDFDDAEPVADLQILQRRAAAAVPVHYVFKKNAATKRINELRAAFRLVRPRYRLYHAERESLLRAQRELRVDSKNKKTRAQHGVKRGSPEKDQEAHRKPSAGDRVREQPQGEVPDPVAALDKRFEEEMRRLRPEFEAHISLQPGKLQREFFQTLRRHQFSDEIELMLSDVAQAVLSQRIVRDKDRLDDDLARGLYDVGTAKQHHRSKTHQLALDLQAANKLCDKYIEEFVRQKRPSVFDDAVLRAAVKALARSMIGPTYQRDLEATERARAQARDQVPKTRVVHYRLGQSLVKRGDLVTVAVQERVDRMMQGMETSDTPRAFIATGLFLGAILALFSAFASSYLPSFRRKPKDIGLLAGILLVHAGTLRLLLELGGLLVDPGGRISATMWVVLLPYALGPTLVTLFLRPMTAAPFALLSTAVATLMAYNTQMLRDEPLLIGLAALVSMIQGMAGVYSTRSFRQRSDLFFGASIVSVFGALTATAVVFFTAPVASDILDLYNGLIVLMGAFSGALSYLLVAALTPIFESVFKRLTDIKLLELTSMNHPALRLIASETPGTFTHSVMVGNLAEAACEAIGANGLLARVGAYYHDIGKTNAPRYFAENQSGENPHTKLKPHLSALIIKGHVKDGIKLLRSFGLPQEVIDFVPQHHGTSLIEHFCNVAKRNAKETGSQVDVSDFRYPGPKPQSKEAALLMIADMVEAAAKAMAEPNPSRISVLVQRLIAKKLSDGQFDECDLTLRELAEAEKAYTKVLAGMHHTRPVYLPPPEQRTDEHTSAKVTQPQRKKRTGEHWNTGVSERRFANSREDVSRLESLGVRDTQPALPGGLPFGGLHRGGASQDKRVAMQEGLKREGEALELEPLVESDVSPSEEEGLPASPTAVITSRREGRH